MKYTNSAASRTRSSESPTPSPLTSNPPLQGA